MNRSLRSTLARAAGLLLALGLAVAANTSSAASWSGTEGGASAGLMFKIVIPAVLVYDTRTGSVYSNDAKAKLMVGQAVPQGDTGAATVNGLPVVRTANADSSRLVRVSGAEASKGVPGGRMSAKLGSNDVLCIP
jgi:hypothetical protein